MKTNLWHRRIAVISSVSLLLAAVTGILWAYAPHLYFKGDYLKKKNAIAAPSVHAARLTPYQAWFKAKAQFQADQQADEVILKKEAGLLVYEIQSKQSKNARFALVDAITGNLLSPLSERICQGIALEYLSNTHPVKAVEFLSGYRHRSGKVVPSVCRVAFTDKSNSEIIIDRTSGQIVEEIDDARAFHFWVMKLHQLQFWGTKKELTIIPGAALLILLATGLTIWYRRWRALR